MTPQRCKECPARILHAILFAIHYPRYSHSPNWVRMRTISSAGLGLGNIQVLQNKHAQKHPAPSTQTQTPRQRITINITNTFAYINAPLRNSLYSITSDAYIIVRCLAALTSISFIFGPFNSTTS